MTSQPAGATLALFTGFAVAGAALILLRRGTRWRNMMVLALLILSGVEAARWISPAWSASPRQLVVDVAGVGLGGAAATRWRRMRMRPAREAPVRVLIDVPRARWRNNPYIHELVRRMPKDIDVIGFDRRSSVLGSYDVVHSHWPEHRLRSAGWRRQVRTYAWWLLWMTRLHVQGIPVVRTQHNRRPHDLGPRAERSLLRLLQPRVRARIWLTEFSRAESGRDSRLDVVIPHGDYRPWIERVRPDGVVSARTPGGPVRLLSMGLLRRYKNVEESIDAVQQCDDFTLSIMGAAADAEYARSIADLVGRTDNVNLVVGRADDQDLVDAVLSADAVLLTYQDLYNSGVVFLALSLGRPVIVRDGPAARELHREYGSWIGRYEGTLTPEGLRRAWHSVAGATGTPVGSPERAWPVVAQAHARLYRKVARSH